MFRIVCRGLVAVGLSLVTYHYSDIGLDTGGVRNCCCLSDITADRGFTTRWLTWQATKRRTQSTSKTRSGKPTSNSRIEGRLGRSQLNKQQSEELNLVWITCCNRAVYSARLLKPITD